MKSHSSCTRYLLTPSIFYALIDVYSKCTTLPKQPLLFHGVAHSIKQIWTIKYSYHLLYPDCVFTPHLSSPQFYCFPPPIIIVSFIIHTFSTNRHHKLSSHHAMLRVWYKMTIRFLAILLVVTLPGLHNSTFRIKLLKIF